MRINRNAVRTMVVAAIIGTAGATGAAAASADTVTELDPRTTGAYCTVTDDDGSTETLFTTFECLVAQNRIDEAERDAEREADREDRQEQAKS